MASSGNTWFKKAQLKQANHTKKVKGIKQRFAADMGQKLDQDKIAATGRQTKGFMLRPRTFGSTVSPLRGN